MDNNFYIRKINENNAASVIQDIGFDKCYINKALAKYNFILLKVNNLTCPQASIIKQSALSIGADAAVHREVITCKVDKSDVLIGCTYSQLKLLAEKLKHQPFKLPKLAELMLNQVQSFEPKPVKINENIFDWSKHT